MASPREGLGASCLSYRRFAFAEIFDGVDPEVVAFLLGTSETHYSGEHRRNAAADIFSNFTDKDIDTLLRAIHNLSHRSDPCKDEDADHLRRTDSWTNRYVRFYGNHTIGDPWGDYFEYHLNKRRSGNPNIFDGQDDLLVRRLKHSLPQIIRRCSSWVERYSCGNGHFNCYSEDCEIHLNKRRSGITETVIQSHSCHNRAGDPLALSYVVSGKPAARRLSLPNTYITPKGLFKDNVAFDDLEFKGVENPLLRGIRTPAGEQRKMSLSAVVEWSRYDSSRTQSLLNSERDDRLDKEQESLFNSNGDWMLWKPPGDATQHVGRNDSWVNRYETTKDDGAHLNKRRSGKADIFLGPMFTIGSTDEEEEELVVKSKKVFATDKHQSWKK